MPGPTPRAAGATWGGPRLAAFFLLLVLPLLALAGELTRDELARRFPPPLRVGEKAADVPVWPITSELEPEAGPVGYAFESVDLAPIPGFEGTPINLLVALDRKGGFIDVEVLHQHEPVFLSGLGEAPLAEFVRQYQGRSVTQQITVSTAYGDNRGAGAGQRVVLDGVSKATASVRIVNQSVLTAALAVARARLGFAAPAERGPPARPRADFFEQAEFAGLLRAGAIGRLHLTNGEVEALFAGSDGAGIDADAVARPRETFIDLYVAYLSAPTPGRALLGEAGYAALQRRLEPGQHAWWVASAGRDVFVDAGFVRGTAPARLSLLQDGVPVELRDADLELHPPPGAPPLNAMLVLRAPPLSGIDPGRAVRVELAITRAQGAMFPRLTQRSVGLDYRAPEDWFDRPPAPLPEWLLAWRERGVELAVIGVALAVLGVVLARPRWLSVAPRRLRAFRIAFLVFTLAYIGWYAQGQLSIVHLTGAVKTLAAGQGLASFLYDPVALVLIAFTLATLVVWGRGTFCGWLCPFGALQELVAMAMRPLVRPRRLPPVLATLLARGRYLILLVLLVSAAIAPRLADSLVEVEPFKTAITVGFDRNWPFVAYALGLVVLGGLYYKFFCRYLCPLGAALAVGGRLRLLDWLPRRPECGRPCQTCRHRCAYEAIARDGGIDYDDCFQCLECVGIYHDEGRCAPVLLQRRKGRVIPVAAAGRQRPAAAGVSGGRVSDTGYCG